MLAPLYGRRGGRGNLPGRPRGRLPHGGILIELDWWGAALRVGRSAFAKGGGTSPHICSLPRDINRIGAESRIFFRDSVVCRRIAQFSDGDRIDGKPDSGRTDRDATSIPSRDGVSTNFDPTTTIDNQKELVCIFLSVQIIPERPSCRSVTKAGSISGLKKEPGGCPPGSLEADRPIRTYSSGQRGPEKR